MRKRIVIPVLLSLLALGTAAPSRAQDIVGADAYQKNCAVCHGPGGKGDGEFADMLTVRPPNLTLLSAKNDGEFPYLRVFHTVDGRTTVRAHGSTIMPIWGDYFRRTAEEAGGGTSGFEYELLIRAQLVSLVDYIQSLQQQ